MGSIRNNPMLRMVLPRFIDQWCTRTSDPSRLWGLALGADLALINGSRLNCLHTGLTALAQRKSLKCWWSVTDAKSLRYQLGCLFEFGHSDLFSRIIYALDEELTFVPNLDHATRCRIEFVRKRLPQCRREGHIRAFDLARVPALARFGYTACFINADEAWEWVARASLAIQPIFPTWHEFAANERLGLEFWLSGETDKADYLPYREWLLTDPDSPWNRMAWKQLLDLPVMSPMHSSFGA